LDDKGQPATQVEASYPDNIQSAFNKIYGNTLEAKRHVPVSTSDPLNRIPGDDGSGSGTVKEISSQEGDYQYQLSDLNSMYQQESTPRLGDPDPVFSQLGKERGLSPEARAQHEKDQQRKAEGQSQSIAGISNIDPEAVKTYDSKLKSDAYSPEMKPHVNAARSAVRRGRITPAEAVASLEQINKQIKEDSDSSRLSDSIGMSGIALNNEGKPTTQIEVSYPENIQNAFDKIYENTPEVKRYKSVSSADDQVEDQLKKRLDRIRKSK
jgi:hypothetical protein